MSIVDCECVQKSGRPTLYALRTCTCACARALSFSLTRYRKVRRDDVTSIAYEPVTRSFTNGGDEEKYDGDDDDDEDEDDEDDEDEEDVVGVRDDTHRKTRISGVDA